MVVLPVQRTVCFDAKVVSASASVNGAAVDVGAETDARVRVELDQYLVSGTPTSITWWVEFASQGGDWFKCHQTPVLALTFDDAYMAARQYDGYMITGEGEQVRLCYQPSSDVTASAYFRVTGAIVVMRGF
jgi:hypothetical protein